MKKVDRIICQMQSEGQLPRVFKNPSEQALVQELTSQGWFVTKRGWPDFACFKGDNLALIEVKRKSSHRLKKDQFRLMTALAKLGVKCFQWSPDEVLKPITAPLLLNKEVP